jgi:hypothetical protein
MPLIVITVLTVIGWIGLEVYTQATSTEIETSYEKYTQRLAPDLNLDIIETVESREDQYLMVERDFLD